MAEAPSPSRSTATTGSPDSPNSAPLRALPRWSLTLVAGVHGLIFFWAGSKLPWSDWSTFAVIAYLLGTGHLLTAIMAAARQKPLAWTWRATSVLGLAVFGWLTWELIRSASYLGGLYGELGKGLGAALLAVIGLVALLTVPLSAWGLAATWERRWNRGATTALALVLVVWTVGSWRTAQAARAQPLPTPVPSQQGYEIYDAITGALPVWSELAELPPSPIPVRDGHRQQLRLPPLFTREPVACVPSPDAQRTGEALAVLGYLVPAKAKTLELRKRSIDGRKLAAVEPVFHCLRAPAEQLPQAIADHLRAEAVRGPVKIDVITGVAMMRSHGFVLDMLALRPGLDGICDADRCLMPWQLLADGQFIGNEPLPWVPDFRFGVSPVRLQRALGGSVPAEVMTWDRHRRRPKTRPKGERELPLIAPAGADEWSSLDGLLRIETTSIVVSAGQAHLLARMHQRVPPMSQQRLRRAQDRAEAYVAAAQLDDGRFNYTVDPFVATRPSKAWNLPRQAGTTLVMCELGRDGERTRAVAARSLEFMASHALRPGDAPIQALVRNPDKNPDKREADLGSTALPTIAFLACRGQVGDQHDRLIAELVGFLLAMQREDGSFYPNYDMKAAAPIDGPEPLYAGGQVIYALSLAEKLSLEQPERAAAIGLPDTDTLHQAIERGMAYYTGPYWDGFLRDFFWLEENWHCLAARASLGHHRNPAYEQFCLDYMAYKARVPLDENSGVPHDFIGGYSVGNILVPVNTPTAGFGEGLAAAMAIKQARGEDISADRAQMRVIMEFLLRQQWAPETCFACDPAQLVVGGFSESMGAPEIRIDYTQHSWAALGHGGAYVMEELEPVWGGDIEPGVAPASAEVVPE